MFHRWTWQRNNVIWCRACTRGCRVSYGHNRMHLHVYHCGILVIIDDRGANEATHKVEHWTNSVSGIKESWLFKLNKTAAKSAQLKTKWNILRVFKWRSIATAGVILRDVQRTVTRLSTGAFAPRYCFLLARLYPPITSKQRNTASLWTIDFSQKLIENNDEKQYEVLSKRVHSGASETS